MTDALKMTLRRVKSGRTVFEMADGGGRVFLCADGKPMAETRLRRRWDRATEGWKQAPAGLRFHDLRHTAASLMVNRGVDLYVVGNVLGHSSAETTKRYAHLVLDRQREAVKKLGDSLRDPQPVSA